MVHSFQYPKPFELKQHVEDFLLENEKLVEGLYVDRPDTYFKRIK